jgi:hypothetical protein
MRKYVILYRRGMGEWGRVTPGVHAGIYDKPAVNDAIAFLQTNPSAEGVVVRLDEELFNIMVCHEPKTPNAFEFEGDPC